MYIQWFPGHMTKALRMIEENLKVIDVVGYVLDARAPFSCFNPAFKKITEGKPCVFILNKADLADEHVTAQWERYFSKQGLSVVKTVSTQTGTTAVVKNAFSDAKKKTVERFAAKGVYRSTRAMILGVPNCGKSTLINALSGKKNAIVGNKPGVTKGKQWIRLEDGLELLDTPGTLWNKFENQAIAENLLFIGSISETVVDSVESACVLLNKLKKNYGEAVMLRYGLDSSDMGLSSGELLEKIAIRRGCLAKGDVDLLRAAKLVYGEFKNGKIGRITLESPIDYGLKNYD